jgi:hypothetical protein
MNYEAYDAQARVQVASIVTFIVNAQKPESADLLDVAIKALMSTTEGSLLGETPSLRKKFVELCNKAKTLFRIAAGKDGDISRMKVQGRLMPLLSEILLEADHLLESDVNEESSDDEVHLLTQWRQYSRNLSSQLVAKGIAYGTAPLICRFPFDRSKLKRKSIPSESFCGYTVLTKQNVLGIGLAYIQAAIDRECELSGESKKAATDKDRESIIKDILDTFLLRHPGMIVLGETGRSWKGGRWFWLVDSKELAMLRQCSFGSPSASGLGNWGFAFEGKDELKRVAPASSPSSTSF